MSNWRSLAIILAVFSQNQCAVDSSTMAVQSAGYS